jgi:hypothetical protein
MILGTCLPLVAILIWAVVYPRRIDRWVVSNTKISDLISGAGLKKAKRMLWCMDFGGGMRDKEATPAPDELDELDKHGFQWLLESVDKIYESKVIPAVAGAAGKAELEWFTMQLVFHMLPLMEKAVGSFKEKATKGFSIDSTDGKEEFAKYLNNAFEAGEVSDIAVGVCLKRRTLLPDGVTQRDCDQIVQAADNTSSTSVDSEAQKDRSSLIEDGWCAFRTRGEDVALTCNPLHNAEFAANSQRRIL